MKTYNTIYKLYYIVSSSWCALFCVFDVINLYLCHTEMWINWWYQISMCLSLIQLGIGVYAYSQNSSAFRNENKRYMERMLLCWKPVFVCLLFLRLGVGYYLSQIGRHIGTSVLGEEIERAIQGKGFVTAICCFSTFIHEYGYDHHRYR